MYHITSSYMGSIVGWNVIMGCMTFSLSPPPSLLKWEKDRDYKEWLTGLRKLRSCKICCSQGKEPRQPMVLLQSKFKDLRSRRISGIISNLKADRLQDRGTNVLVWVQRQEKTDVLAHAVKQKEFLSAFFFYLGPQLTGWDPTTLGWIILYSVYSLKC